MRAIKKGSQKQIFINPSELSLKLLCPYCKQLFS